MFSHKTRRKIKQKSKQQMCILNNSVVKSWMFHALAEDGWSIRKNREGNREYENQQACPFCSGVDMDNGKLRLAGKVFHHLLRKKKKDSWDPKFPGITIFEQWKCWNRVHKWSWVNLKTMLRNTKRGQRITKAVAVPSYKANKIQTWMCF